MTNISPFVRQAMERRLAQARTAFAAPDQSPPDPEPVPVQEPEQEVAAVLDDEDDEPGLHGDAVDPDPEHDTPPQPPADGAYGYQTHVVITPARAEYLIGLNA